MKKNGQAVILAVLLFFIGSFIFIVGIAAPVTAHLREVGDLGRSKQSFYLSESSIEDVMYRVMNALSVSPTETLTIDGFAASTSVVDIPGGKRITANGDTANLIRKSQAEVIEGIGVAFFYGMQSDNGGVFMENFSSVVGNLYSNGPITGQNLNMVYGTVVSAGPSGFLDEVHATGSAYAYEIEDSQIDGNAYYDTTITNTLVSGNLYPGSPNQATSSLPISDALIDLWKAEAEAGGTITGTCPYQVSSSTTLGPIKINCDLTIDSPTATVTLGGPVWVVGNINMKSGPTIRIDPSLGSKSVPMIAHNPADRITSSKIILENNTVFQGSGTPNTYVLMISQNNSAELGGAQEAIDVKNSATGAFLVYAAHGEIILQNNISLKEVSAYKIHLKNSAQVVYETGLASLLFSSGPGGGFDIDTWKEIQ